MNPRLASSPSLYLRQHAGDPVDWYPWGEEALERAKAEDKPIFLSVGYSSCHWCHVMAHESFQDPEVARVLNHSFVSIKLDREERPDLDDLYMTALQLAMGHGGWPMTIFLTPDLKPWFVGTYFPRNARGEVPGFVTVASSLAQAWQDQRADIQERADEFAAAIDQVRERTLPAERARLDTALVDGAIRTLHGDFDHERGGYGDKPKFPPFSTLEYLLKYASARNMLPGDAATTDSLVQEAAYQALFTLECMANGGIHDRVGGGFHRYSTDGEWRLPHFEKMLSDNAQMLALYATAGRIVEDDSMQSVFKQVEEGILRWLREEMWLPDGSYANALDADVDGEEGTTYTWSWSELEAVLGDQMGAFAEAHGLRPEGNFHDEATGQLMGQNLLLGPLDPDWAGACAKLRELRRDRPQPQRDEKAIAAVQGLLIGALAFADALDEAQALAAKWAAFDPESLPHMLVDGEPHGEAFLDDFAFLIQGFLRLADSSGNEQWREAAHRFAEVMMARFRDDEVGDFFYQPAHMGIGFARAKPILDQAVPSANGSAILVLQRLGFAEDAARALRANLGWIERMPQSCESLLSAALAHIIAQGPDEATSAPVTPTKLNVRLETQEVTPGDDGWAHTALLIEIPKGYRINSTDPPAKWLIPTTLHIDHLLGEAGFPSATDDHYEGQLRVPIRLQPRGKTTAFTLRLRYQLCTDRECLAPAEAEVEGIVIQD